MSDQEHIRIFVAHAFEKHADYLRVFEYLESRESFRYLTTSDPERNPGTDREAIREELRQQIREAEIMVLPVSIYEANRELVSFQMDVAGAFDKPILAIKAFGETVVLQKTVMERATEIIDWNERTMVDAIRKLARGEDTQRWEVIEFKLD